METEPLQSINTKQEVLNKTKKERKKERKNERNKE